MEKIAVVRVRGLWGVKPKIRTTLEKLNLTRVNHCVVVDDNPYYRGMLNVVKDYVAYGPISPVMMERLIKKRGEFSRKRKVELSDEEIKQFVKEFFEGKKTLKDLGIKPVFRLNPPRKGYRSIKRPYPYGALGKWPTLDELLMKMV
ncbi:50S ribosomal protein L30 [Candidatus Micrarchaeota archaeon]|nr:50S ribosomal protein L30 [Candidatus Micrarchaeota archaeon]